MNSAETADAETIDPATSWPSLRVSDWTPTRETLHMWTQIVGKIRMAHAPLLNHWWQVTLYVSPRGLTTAAIPYRTGALARGSSAAVTRLWIGRPDAAMSVPSLAGSGGSMQRPLDKRRPDAAVRSTPAPATPARRVSWAARYRLIVRETPRLAMTRRWLIPQ